MYYHDGFKQPGERLAMHRYIRSVTLALCLSLPIAMASCSSSTSPKVSKAPVSVTSVSTTLPATTLPATTLPATTLPATDVGDWDSAAGQAFTDNFLKTCESAAGSSSLNVKSYCQCAVDYFEQHSTPDTVLEHLSTMTQEAAAQCKDELTS